jgi:hypothetical protein
MTARMSEKWFDTKMTHRKGKYENSHHTAEAIPALFLLSTGSCSRNLHKDNKKKAKLTARA